MAKHVHKVLLVEGGPDYLAACQLIAESESIKNILPVAMLGASATISSDALTHFRDRHVTVVAHGDDAGRTAGMRWATQVQAVAAKVRLVAMTTGDLCDAVTQGANQQGAGSAMKNLVEELQLPETSGSEIDNGNRPKTPVLPIARPLIDFGDTPPDPEKTLLGDRFLCREGGMLFVGPSGIGKTSAGVQQDLLWSMGLPAFGIIPAGPLKILTIQAEDDDGHLSEMGFGSQSRASTQYGAIAAEP
jgi:hypothetical protein